MTRPRRRLHQRPAGAITVVMAMYGLTEVASEILVRSLFPQSSELVFEDADSVRARQLGGGTEDTA
jgi:hypothetical protein